VTKEQFEQYAREKIGSYSQQVGIPGPPQITFYDVHNYQAASVLARSDSRRWRWPGPGSVRLAPTRL
jgi:hypothetical protein